MQQNLTAWEAKERAGLLALETDEWCEKRLLAENPNTTADVLLNLAKTAAARQHCTVVAREVYPDASLLCDALLAHPNLRPDCMMPLLKSATWQRRSIGRAFAAFCQNPILLFLPLEVPTFWQDVTDMVAMRLLCEPALPPLAAATFKNHIYATVAQEAHLHVSFSGDLPIGRDGEKALTRYWKTDCPANPNFEHNDCPAEWKFQLAKWGLAPHWAADLPGPRRTLTKKATAQITTLPYRRYLRCGLPPVCPEELVEFVRTEQRVPAFARFAAIPCGAYSLGYLYKQSLLPEGLARLHAALRLPLTDAPFPHDPWNRSPLDLMHHLAHDGNRLVRWAAQTRLADPNFIFTWHEDTN